MKKTIIALLAGLSLAGVAGCQKGTEPSRTGSDSAAAPSVQTTQSSSPEGEIRAAIQEHLEHASNLNLQAFDTDVKQVAVQGNHAEAHVDFHIKGGPGVMQLTYQLENRQGKWTVVESNPVGSGFSHLPAVQSQAPGAGAAPRGNSHSLSDTLRSFKEGGVETPPQLPPGHPASNNDADSAPR